MAEKILQTKIRLLTRTYEAWTTTHANDVLLKGEIGICEIPSNSGVATTAPTILFKVGDGVLPYYNEDPSKCLKWTSALAADVYEWAKKNEVKTLGEGNAVTSIEIKDGYLTFNKEKTFATVEQLEEIVGGLDADTNTRYHFEVPAEGDNANKLVIKKKDITDADYVAYQVVDILTESELNTTLAGYYTKEEVDGLLGGYYTKGEVDGFVSGLDEKIDGVVDGLGDAAYVTVESLNATAKGYADAVEAKIPTEVGVMTVAAADDTIVVEGEKDVTIKVAPNKFDAYGAAETVQGNLTAYEEAHKDDYTNTKIDELVQGAKDYADANDANTEYHVEYDSTNKKIKLVAGADASKMEIDATDFIKDGMISSVELVTEDGEGNKGQFLKITWNTDGDVDADDVTYVNVTTLVDIYVGENGDYVNVTVTSDNKIKADLTDAAKTKLNKVWEEAGVAAGLDATLKAELQKEIDDDIAAYNTSKNFGDIITHNAAEYQKANDTLKHIADNYTVNVYGYFNENVMVGETPDAMASLHGEGLLINCDAEQGTTQYTRDTITRHNGQNDIDHIYNLPTESGTIATQEWVGSQGYATEDWVEGKNYLTEITTTANNGLKVNKNHIDIDTDVVFVLDCNW